MVWLKKNSFHSCLKFRKVEGLELNNVLCMELICSGILISAFADVLVFRCHRSVCVCVCV